MPRHCIVADCDGVRGTTLQLLQPSKECCDKKEVDKNPLKSREDI